MWILFLVLITEPGQFQVQVIEVYKTRDAEAVCKAEAKRLDADFKVTYPSAVEKDTWSFTCVKQKDFTT